MSETPLTIDNILVPELALCRVPASSKKRVLEYIAEQIHHRDETLSETQIFNNLIGRERLGSTGIGQGIAIPHCRLEGLDHVVGVLLTLTVVLRPGVRVRASSLMPLITSRWIWCSPWSSPRKPPASILNYSASSRKNSMSGVSATGSGRVKTPTRSMGA